MEKTDKIKSIIIQSLQNNSSFDNAAEEIAALFEPKPEPPVEPAPAIWQFRNDDGEIWTNGLLVAANKGGQYPFESRILYWQQCRLNPAYAGLMVIHRHDGGPQPEETRGKMVIVWWSDKSGGVNRHRSAANIWMQWPQTYAYAIIPEIKP